MVKLVHGQRIRTINSTSIDKITVGTIEGFYTENGMNVVEGLAQARALGQELAYTMQSGHVVTSDYEGKAEAIEAEKIAHDSYQILKEGDIVEIESRLYTVKIMGLRYSDPIHFIPIK